MSLEHATLRAYLEAAGLRFGFAAEIVTCSEKVQGGVANSVPPRDLWPRIVPTVRLVEAVREHFGPTRIHSAYRSPAYNRAVGGAATDSQHTHFRALDFSCATGTPAAWAALLRDLRAGGAFQGGIGVYRTFVHVDTRGTRADWSGS